MSNHTQVAPAQALNNPFIFSNHEVRTAVDGQGEVWFSAKDVCTSLNITWSGSTLRSYPDHWKFMLRDNMNQGGEGLLMLSEPGVYRLIFRSQKPEAVKFADWICEEVLPAIRKQGYFGTVPPKEQIAISREIRLLVADLRSTRDAFTHKILTNRLRSLCNQLGEPIPDITLLGQNIDQLSLELDGE